MLNQKEETVAMNGVFAIAKPAGISSAKLLAKVQNLFNSSKVFANDLKIIKEATINNFKQQYPNRNPSRKVYNRVKIKMGHGGTLDVGASGVLVIGVGAGTKKLQSYLNDCIKSYETDAVLGASTTSGDFEGEVLSLNDVRHITKQQVLDTGAKFTGDIVQTPPIFSAIKINGKKLYEYAREGIPLPKPIKERNVKIHELKFDEDSILSTDHSYKLVQPEVDEDGKTIVSKLASISNLNEDQLHFSKQYIEKYKNDNDGKDVEHIKSKPIDDPEYEKEILSESYVPPIIRFSTTVSSGTYIRSLISDIGKALGSSSYMTKLVRSRQGDWRLNENVFTIEDFSKYHEDVWGKVLKSVFDNGAAINLQEVLEKENEEFLKQHPEEAGHVYKFMESDTDEDIQSYHKKFSNNKRKRGTPDDNDADENPKKKQDS